MELAVRKGSDAFVPAGAYRKLEERLRRRLPDLCERPAVVLSAFDPSTRLLPFVLYDRLIFPAGARAVAGALYQAGFGRSRAVFQLWNPRFRPSQARLDGRIPQLLCVSSMQIHARPAYAAIRDAWQLGEDRPLIIAGGPKAIYEPYHFWNHPQPPDVAVTGEVYVLLDLLNVVVQYLGRKDTLRTAFDRARREGALESVPGLVYLDPDATVEDPLLVDTGLQRLVQHLDELPREVTGLGLLEPPSRRDGLAAAPVSDSKVRRYAHIVSLLMTQGCKFSCPYCPIPAFNQKTWRFRSPEGIVEQMRSVHERFGIKYFFGSDDNFFNRRQTALEIFEALAAAHTGRHPLGSRVRWATEATQHDTWKNRDLLALGRQAGLHGIWFGIEDLTAALINKGQKPEVTLELFRLMHRLKISPMAMMMYHDGQPFATPGRLYGLANQVEFLRQAGAISLQVTVHTPAVGTREFEKTYATGRVVKQLGRYPVPEAKFDGNHVLLAGGEPMWLRQLKLLGGYAAFYNPLNLFRSLKKDGSPIRRRRVGYQLAGFVATLWTAWKVLPFIGRLLVSRKVCHPAAPAAPVPVRLAAGAFAREPEDEAAVSSSPVSGTRSPVPSRSGASA